MAADMMVVWGSWELLLLGGAVLRHGTHDWNTIASELRVRTVCPYNFTPESCKTKYEELQRQYSSCKDLFEELKKQRVAELKRTLEKCDDSIGSLQSKLRNLEAQNSDGTESSGKEISKDGLSAGSFTQETNTEWYPKIYQISIPNKKISDFSEQEKLSSMENLSETIQSEQGGNIRKRRGKRKRKEWHGDFNETSVGESEFLSHAETPRKENSTIREGTDDLMRLFDLVVNNENAASFFRKHDSQKRARYRNLVRQHMDLNTIKSRITKQTIKSTKEVFRDLLLLTNNALIFYSKTTREHKCALLLRDHILKTLRQDNKCPANKTVAAAAAAKPTVFFRPAMSHAPVKPRSARPCHRKIMSITCNNRVNHEHNISLGWTSQVEQKQSKFDALMVSRLSTKGDISHHPKKSGRALVRKQHEGSLKERKRASRR